MLDVSKPREFSFKSPYSPHLSLGRDSPLELGKLTLAHKYADPDCAKDTGTGSTGHLGWDL